jgi:hypothetical protein
MLSSLLQRSSGSDHFFIIIIVLLLLILALSAWNWATTMPRPVQALIGWAAVILVFLLASELLPWQATVAVGQQIGLDAFAWMDGHPMIVLLVLPALMFGSLMWRKQI